MPLPHEAELLLLCARTTLSEDHAARIVALVDMELDWRYIQRRASSQGVTQLLYWNLNAVNPPGMPSEIHTKLAARFQANVRHNMLLAGELVKILSLFEQEGITAVPYKGPLLAMAAYDNLALRQFQDLDLFIHESDLTRARDLLVAAGYRSQFNLTSQQIEPFVRNQNELLLSRESDGVIVELHWRISPRYFAFPLDGDVLWRRLESASIFGRETQSLAGVDLLLILCAHGAKHNWERLAWICDVAELMSRREDITWEEVLDRAVQLGSERMALLAALLVGDLLSVELPEPVRTRINAEPEIAELCDAVRNQIFRDAEYNVEVMNRSRFHLLSRERWRDRIRYSISRATQPTMEDWEQLRLPPALMRLYPLMRPFRLAYKHGMRLVRRRR